jgi:hypothetical protein
MLSPGDRDRMLDVFRLLDAQDAQDQVVPKVVNRLC